MARIRPSGAVSNGRTPPGAEKSCRGIPECNSLPCGWTSTATSMPAAS